MKRYIFVLVILYVAIHVNGAGSERVSKVDGIRCDCYKVTIHESKLKTIFNSDCWPEYICVRPHYVHRAETNITRL